jgi:hypothetical protein
MNQPTTNQTVIAEMAESLRRMADKASVKADFCDAHNSPVSAQDERDLSRLYATAAAALENVEQFRTIWKLEGAIEALEQLEHVDRLKLLGDLRMKYRHEAAAANPEGKLAL